MFEKVEGIYVIFEFKLGYLSLFTTEGGKVCKIGSWMLYFGQGVSSWSYVDNGW